MCVKSSTDIGTATKVEYFLVDVLNSDTELPTRVNLRMLVALPKLVKSRIEADALHRLRPRSESELPIAVSYRTDKFKSDPLLQTRKSDKLEFIRIKYLMDNDDPVWKYSTVLRRVDPLTREYARILALLLR